MIHLRTVLLAKKNPKPKHTATLQLTATHYNTLQHTATVQPHGSYLHAALFAKLNTKPKQIATNCNTLQHIAMQCNTVQYSATHCKILQI